MPCVQTLWSLQLKPLRVTQLILIGFNLGLACTLTHRLAFRLISSKSDPSALSSAWPIFSNFLSKSRFRYPETMRSRSSEVEMPGVRRVGMNLPNRISLKKVERKREHTLGLYKRVHIIMTLRHVWELIMSNIVDVPLFQERLVDDPWAVRNDLVNPATMSHSFASILGVSIGCQRIQVSYRSACVMTQRALLVMTSSSELTPTSKCTDGKESLACRNCRAWLVRNQYGYGEGETCLPKVE